jgi:hypothetical protein
MKTATNVLFVLAMGVMMVTTSALFTAGYPSIYAKKSSDSGSDNSGSGNGGSASNDNGEQEHEQTKINDPPTDAGKEGNLDDKKPLPQQPPPDASTCVVGGGPPCNPEQQPQQPTPPTNGEGPDQDCLFNPSLPKCKSDKGKCPDGFFQNEDGNCFPKHDKCPSGFHSHENDETGRCIPDSTRCEPGFIRNPDFPTCSSKDSVCRDHPQLTECGVININIIIKNIIHKSGSSGHSSSSSISKDCYDAIKIAWLGKIHRGQNPEVDSFIDKCIMGR